MTVKGGGRLVVKLLRLAKLFSITCHWQRYNVTLYATRKMSVLTETEVLVTKEKLVCADSGWSYLKIRGRSGVGLGERWGG